MAAARAAITIWPCSFVEIGFISKIFVGVSQAWLVDCNQCQQQFSGILAVTTLTKLRADGIS